MFKLGFFAVCAQMLVWALMIWFVCCVAWPWLAAILRANGMRGI